MILAIWRTCPRTVATILGGCLAPEDQSMRRRRRRVLRLMDGKMFFHSTSVDIEAKMFLCPIRKFFKFYHGNCWIAKRKIWLPKK